MLIGVTLHSHLTFNSHVNNIATVIKQKNRSFKKVKTSFWLEAINVHIYWGYVLPHILYCANVWSGRSNRNHDTLNKLHKRAAYKVSKKTWLTPSNEVFSDLSWPSLEKLLWKASCCMIYKCVKQIKPQIIYDKITFSDSVKSRLTRDTGKMLLRWPHCRIQSFTNDLSLSRHVIIGTTPSLTSPLLSKSRQAYPVFKKNLNVT